jgi:GntR family transcriptional repressor for pyruvate dehydrogenase complex
LYTPVKSARLYEQIVEQIKERILSGDLQDGDQLPTERELAEQFGVSRTAVREAIKALTQSGLVEVRPGRGTFVIDGTLRAVKRSLDLMIRIERGDKWADLVEIRGILEPEIASLAAMRADEEHITTMREAVTAMDAALDDADAFITADDEFHLALAKGTQNALVPTLIDSIVDLLHEQRKRIFTVRGGPQRGQYHHKRILDAIVRRDPQVAREVMCAHLEQVRKDSEAATVLKD